MFFIPTFEDDQQSLVFLDLIIERTPSGLITKFYRKDTHSGTYLHFSSHAPMALKINIVRNEAKRITSNCSIADDAKPHLDLLFTNLQKCGYPDHFILKYFHEAMSPVPAQRPPREPFDPKVPLLKIPYISEAVTRIIKAEIKKAGLEVKVIVQAGQNLRRTYHRATPRTCTCDVCDLGIPCHTRHVIYEAECNICHGSYDGVTTRPFKKREDEHDRALRYRNPDKSALAEHRQECTGEWSTKSFTWKILDRGNGWKDSFIRESLQIKKNNPSLNRNWPGWTI